MVGQSYFAQVKKEYSLTDRNKNTPNLFLQEINNEVRRVCVSRGHWEILLAINRFCTIWWEQICPVGLKRRRTRRTIIYVQTSQ